MGVVYWMGHWGIVWGVDEMWNVDCGVWVCDIVMWKVDCGVWREVGAGLWYGNGIWNGWHGCCWVLCIGWGIGALCG